MNEKKTQRKNNTNLNINWPPKDEYFTIKSLSALNPNFVNITLRVRLKKAIDEDKIVVAIGTRNNKKGRPELILAMSPVEPSVLEKTKNENIVLFENPTVPVMNVTNTNNVISHTSTLNAVRVSPDTLMPISA